jgi:hypothetical protein
LVPRTHENVSRSSAVSMCTTWFSACTPLSVRPAHSVRTGSAAKAVSAFSSKSCTVRPSGWDCQPW